MCVCGCIKGGATAAAVAATATGFIGAPRVEGMSLVVGCCLKLLRRVNVANVPRTPTTTM